MRAATEDHLLADQAAPFVSGIAPMSLAALGVTQPPPRKFILPGLIMENTRNAFHGDGGVGKTRLALQMACAIAAGVRVCGITPHRTGPVAFISAEEDENSVWIILDEIVRGSAYSPTDVALIRNGLHVFVTTEETVLFEGGNLTQHGKAVMRAAGALKPLLVIMDNVSACVATEGVFDPAVPYRVMGALHALVKAQNGASMVLMHETKQSAREGNGVHAYSGSAAWSNAARHRLRLSKDTQEPAVRILKNEKFNYGPDGDGGVRLVWDSGAWALEESGGIIDTIRNKADARAVVRLLQELGKAGQMASVNTTANNNPWSLVMKLGISTAGLTKTRFWKGHKEAASRGWIRIETVRKDRRDREVWVITQAGEQEACSHVPA